MRWSQERTDLLKARWIAGDTAHRIAGVLKITDNAVIGKVNRLGLSGSHKGPPTKSERKARRDPSLVSPHVAATAPVVNGSNPVAPEPVSAPREPVTLAELQPFHCRAVVSLSPPLYCGGQRVAGLPYCDACARLHFAGARTAPSTMHI